MMTGDFHRFLKVGDLKQALEKDSNSPTRYPVRFIHVKNLEAWEDICNFLAAKCGFVIYLSTLCKQDDLLPYTDNLIKILKEHYNTNIMILPLAEYCRLTSRSDIISSLFTYEQSGTRRRIYIPLFSLQQMLEAELSNLTRLQHREQVYALENTSFVKDRYCTVFLPSEINLMNLRKKTYCGLKEYFKLWEQRGVKNCYVTTSHTGAIKETFGEYSVEVRRNAHEVAKAWFSDGSLLEKQEWGNSAQWEMLLREGIKYESLKKFFSVLFNINDFKRLYTLTSQWKNWDDDLKWLYWLCCKIYKQDGYFGYVIDKSNNIEQFLDGIFTCVLSICNLDEETEITWLKERRKLLINMGIEYLPDSFLNEVCNLPDMEKVKVLPGITKEEREIILVTVARLLHNNTKHAAKWKKYLDISFHELVLYMEQIWLGEEETSLYYRAYVDAKVKNTITNDIRTLNLKMYRDQKLWSFPSRRDILQKYLSKDTYFIWVDGMGVDWLGVVKDSIGQLRHDVKIHFIIAQAQLPSVTSENNHWAEQEKVNYHIFRDFDDNNHKGKYPDYIVKQFELIKEVAKFTVDKLNSYSRVVITSDHGASRLAALNISIEESIEPPTDAKVYEMGRYCVTNSNNCGDYDECIRVNNGLVFATYKRFKSKGNAYGELHGGATFEEALVPIIIVEKGFSRDTFIFREANQIIKLDRKRQGRLVIYFDGIVHSLLLSVEGRFIKGIIENNSCSFDVTGISVGKHKAQVYIDNNLLAGEIEFEIKTSGIEILNDF